MSAEMFEAFDAYPYDQDAEFGLGLNSILQHAQDELHAKQLEKQARSFYFKRKTGTQIDLNAYDAWKASKPASKGKGLATSTQEKSPEVTESKQEAAPAVPLSAIEQSIASATVLSTTAGGDDSDAKLSYQQIVEMIRDGKETDLPGIKDIPDTVLEGQGTTSTQAQRRKPWEKNQEATGIEPIAAAEVSISQ